MGKLVVHRPRYRHEALLLTVPVLMMTAPASIDGPVVVESYVPLIAQAMSGWDGGAMRPPAQRLPTSV